MVGCHVQLGGAKGVPLRRPIQKHDRLLSRRMHRISPKLNKNVHFYMTHVFGLKKVSKITCSHKDDSANAVGDAVAWKERRLLVWGQVGHET